jgi:hypothetical protein
MHEDVDACPHQVTSVPLATDLPECEQHVE